MTGAPQARRIILCADDYGLSPGVNRAIRALIAMGRLNATSVMIPAPAFTRAETDALKSAIGDAGRCAIGLHVTLTAPFQPLTLYFRPLDGGIFLPLSQLLRASLMRRLDRDIVREEIAAQLAAFGEAFGRPPDYVDGHQHVHLFPQIRDAFLSAVNEAAPRAWVRQCGRAAPQPLRLSDAKALFLDLLSSRFRVRAAKAGVAFNPAFAGAYNFTQVSAFAPHLTRFIQDLPDGGLIMCHPGFVDDTLVELDPLIGQREREYEFLAGDEFPRLLAAQNAVLAPH